MSDQYFDPNDNNRVYSKINIACEIRTMPNGEIRTVLEFINLPTYEVAESVSKRLNKLSRDVALESVMECLDDVKVLAEGSYSDTVDEKLPEGATIIPIREVSTKLQ